MRSASQKSSTIRSITWFTAAVWLATAGCASISPRPAEGPTRFGRSVWDTPATERRRPAPVARRSGRKGLERIAWTLKRCRRVRGKKATVFGVGSSTMRILLGPALKRLFRRAPFTYGYRGVPASGIARPDYFDWQAEMPEVRQAHRPDVWIVSLGTNDLQHLRKYGGGWLKFGTRAWRKRYAGRIDRLLSIMSGAGRRSAVIWVGPTAFNSRNSLSRGPVLTDLMRERVEAFAGPAMFFDAHRATTDTRGIPLRRIRVTGRSDPIEVYGNDGIHLKRRAVRALIAEPVRQLILSCLAGRRW